MKKRLQRNLTLCLAIASCLYLLGFGQKIISWKDAHKYYGYIVTVEGKVVTTYNSGKACFLNFHPDYKKYFTAVIFRSDFNKFPDYPHDYYLNKRVHVTGEIKEYQGKPEIILKDLSQIKIIDESEKSDIQEKKEIKVHITKTGERYHRSNCRFLKKSKIEISLKKACEKKYTPCKVCNPPKCKIDQ